MAIIGKSQPEVLATNLFTTLVNSRLWQLVAREQNGDRRLLLAQQELEDVAQRHYAFHALAASFHDEHAPHT